MNIFDCINKTSLYLINFELGKTFDTIIEKDQDESYFIVPNSVLLDSSGIEKLLEKYYIHGLFELSNCYLGAFGEPYMLWHISKEKPNDVAISVFYENAHPYSKEYDNQKGIRVSDLYTDSFMGYISLLEKWLVHNDYPQVETLKYEFDIIPYCDFDSEILLPRYYRKENSEIRSMLKKAKFVKLSDIAEVLSPLPLNTSEKEGACKSLNPNKSPEYPYVPELCAVDSYKTSELIHKGDIVRLGKFDFFLADKESSFDLYAPIGRKLIRSNDYTPEYLYFYLNSKLARRINRMMEVPLGYYSKTYLKGGEIDDFPILVPSKKQEYYVQEFYNKTTPNGNYYEETYNKEAKTLEDLLTAELVEDNIKCGKDLLKKQIIEDVSELNTCFCVGAYKAAIILSGSILETILIDWLSEIKGKDYFNNPFYKREYDKINKCYKKKDDGSYIYTTDRAGLADYIDEIRDIKEPNWNKEAKMANTIKDRRNRVHAKKCLKDSEKINKTICEDTIQLLKNIINSRKID